MTLLLLALIGVSACTVESPAVPAVTDEWPPTPTAPVVGVTQPTPPPTAPPTPLPTPLPTLEPQPSPTITPRPTFSLGLPSIEPDDVVPARGPYSVRTPAPTVPGPSPSDPPATTPGGPLVEWNGTPGKPATRIVISGLKIDLAVIKGDSRYPKCDVAQYLPSPFVSPGVAGSTYIYGHAQRGMFLPLLQASKRNNGAEMIGMRIDVYTSANARYVYEIYRVKRHATDFSLALNLKAGEHRLVVQTSEGPSAAYPKLQVAARLKGIYQATKAQAQPAAKPRTCG